jgi:hypothetical protein
MRIHLSLLHNQKVLMKKKKENKDTELLLMIGKNLMKHVEILLIIMIKMVMDKWILMSY